MGLSDAPALRDPLVDGKVAHPPGYVRRRFLNWFPLGVAYAMLYMGRYNLNVAQGALGALMPKDSFGEIFGLGAIVYGFAFLLNGPLTDRMGGRRAMLLALGGALAANLSMGLYVREAMLSGEADVDSVKRVFKALYAVNMYFQSFGAVAIVKVNASWFHVRERGGFSGIFGAMISTGIFFAFDVNQRVLNAVTPESPLRWFPPQWAVPAGLRAFGKYTAETLAPSWDVFLLPAATLGAILVFELIFLRDAPSDAGHVDIETGDASTGEAAGRVPTLELLRRILTNRVIMTVALIEFCTGVARDGVSQWFRIYAGDQVKLLGASSDAAWWWQYTIDNLGLQTCIAGIIGGNVAGWMSDKAFGSRRGPAAFLLYALLCGCIGAMMVSLQNGFAMCVIAFLVSVCVIGAHGLLSGTATMDFGGKKGAATAVGVIDGFVYLGVGLQAMALGKITKESWDGWPRFLAPFVVAGALLLLTIWRAMPARKRGAGH